MNEEEKKQVDPKWWDMMFKPSGIKGYTNGHPLMWIGVVIAWGIIIFMIIKKIT